MKKLTPKQKALCDFVRSFTNEQGYPPTVREIGAAMGLSSPSSVYFHIRRLQEQGLLTIERGRTRSITLVEELLPQRGHVPLLGEVAAGVPILAQENIEEYVPFDTGRHPEEFFALRVRGESMLGAGILPGDLVIVHAQVQAQSGEIVVALFENEATVKTLSLKGGEVWLLPENPDYQPIDGRDAQILGKVVGLVRRF